MLRDLSFWMVNLRKRKALRCTAVVSAAMIFAVGCKVGPDYNAPPTPKVQSDWSEKSLESQQAPSGEVPRLHNELPALDDWWSVFHDETMNVLLKTVNEQNLDIKIAAQRIYQAEMDYRYTRGELFPAIGTGATFSRNMLPGGGFTKHNYGSAWTLDASASWEVDVFGQIKRYIEAYDAAWQASVEDLNNTKMLLLAETARTYINARLFQEEEQIIRAEIRDLETYLEKIQIRAEAGADCKVELVQAQANLATVKASLPTIQVSYESCVNRLSSLMGASPTTVRELLSRDNGVIPNAPDALAIGIPADILRRRPDIRGLERRLAQQSALIGANQAEMYPKFFINGSFGLQADNIEDLFNSRSITASLMPRLQWRIFEFGRVRCSIAKQESVTEQMRLEYQQAVLEAAEEVNNAITSYVKLQNQFDEQVEAVKNYDEALKLSLDLYDAGKREYMVVLDSQRYLLSNRRTLVQIHAQLASSVVTLYTALGGGWQVDPQAQTSLSGTYLRGGYLGTAQIQLSVPGEGINQQGTLNQRAVPPQIQQSSKAHIGYSYELPPEGLYQRQDERPRTRSIPVESLPTTPTVPTRPKVDESEFEDEVDISTFPIPTTQKKAKRSVLSPQQAQELQQRGRKTVDPLLAELEETL